MDQDSKQPTPPLPDNAPDLSAPRSMNRRKFFEVVAGAAAAGAILSQTGSDANAAAQQYLYQDSFGNIVPAGQDAIDLGVFPPPFPQELAQQNQQGERLHEHSHSGRRQALDDVQSGASGNNTYYAPTYPKYNVLLIVVDQMRNPTMWLPANNATTTGQNQVNAAIPGIANLASQSFFFPQYYTAATVCGPARACMQTGLYTQQHCLFRSSANPLRPYNPAWTADGMNGSPGFPTIGNVLSQVLSLNNTPATAQYNCTFIGKWHLSCMTGNNDGSVGQNGPRDYGYATNSNPRYDYCIPRAQGPSPYPVSPTQLGYPSPNGIDNQGVSGDFLDSYAQTTPGRDLPTGFNNSVPVYPHGSLVELNDTAIREAFTQWLTYASTHLSGNVNGILSHPWFCTVSFVNPHDITDFPYSFGLTGQGNSNFTDPTGPGNNGYQPVQPSGAPQTFHGNNCLGGSGMCATDGDVINVPRFLNVFASLPPGNGTSTGRWNWEDVTTPAYSSGGKPGFQAYFLSSGNAQFGAMHSPGVYSGTSWSTPTAWETFLNYYLWMQSCADYQVGQVLQGAGGLIKYPEFWNDTVVIFTSDHGDYGGSHGLHAKGGAAYDESINVPLYASFPNMRPPDGSNGTGPYAVPYVCSSVDLLPFLYSLVLGNASWRGNNNDMVYYLRGREAIEDAIFEYTQGAFYPQRRLSGIPLYAGNQACGQTCPDSQEYQPFILHTADDFSFTFSPQHPGPNPTYQPTHIVAFRTVDYTDVNNNSAPFYPNNSYGGGKLVEYGYWNTEGANTAPIKPINAIVNGVDATSQFEFYNYSPHPNAGSLSANPQEIGNQFFDAGLSTTLEAQAYLNNFNDSNPAHGNVIQNELYVLKSSGGGNASQQAAAVSVAFTDYNNYLANTQQLAGSDGRQVANQAANNSYVRWDLLFDPF